MGDNMKGPFYFLSLAVFLIFVVKSAAIPPSDEIIEKLKREGRFEQFIEVQRHAHERGMDKPSEMSSKTMRNRALSGPAANKVLVILINFSDKPYTAGSIAGTPRGGCGNSDSCLRWI